MRHLSKKTKEVYKKIIDEQHYCQLCGSANWLEIHHIYYRSQGGLKKWQPFLLEMQYKKYGNFTQDDVTNCKKYFKID